MNIASGLAPKKHLPALDGLRGIAILMVLAVHLEYTNHVPGTSRWLKHFRELMYSGWSGVDLFFVLSGFLITGILLDTKEKPDAGRNFYIRRILRIFPLYYAVLAIGSLPVLSEMFPGPKGWSWFLLYLQNWWAPFGNDRHFLGHFWSLAVEEQFYLLWPLCVWNMGRKALFRSALTGIIAAFILRVIWVQATGPSAAILMNTFTRMDALLCGAACAILIRNESMLARVRPFLPWVITGCAMGMIVIDYGPAHEIRSRAAYTQTIGFSLLAFGYGATVLATYLSSRSGGWISRILSLYPFRQIGKYSYGIYVYHPFVLYGFSFVWPRPSLIACFSMTAGSFLVAVVSYELFEKRFLLLKDRLAPNTPSIGNTERLVSASQQIVRHIDAAMRS